MLIGNQTNVQLVIRKQGAYVHTEFYFSISNAIERAIELGIDNCYILFRDYVETDLTKYSLRNIISPNSKALVTYFNTDKDIKMVEVSSTMMLMGFIENEDYTEIISVVNTNTELFKLSRILEYYTEPLVKNYFELLMHDEKQSFKFSVMDKNIYIENSIRIMDELKRKELGIV